MKKLPIILTAMATLFSQAPSLSAADPARVGVVKFRECIETSRIGKQEQEAFEALRQRMQNVLSEKEKALTEISQKFQDPDLLDSLSAEAEAELKNKFRMLSQDLNQFQNEYYQQLQQANMRIMQQISSVVADAANKVAKSEGLDAVVNEDSFFYFAPAMDVTAKVVQEMNTSFDEHTKDQQDA